MAHVSAGRISQRSPRPSAGFEASASRPWRNLSRPKRSPTTARRRPGSSWRIWSTGFAASRRLRTRCGMRWVRGQHPSRSGWNLLRRMKWSYHEPDSWSGHLLPRGNKSPRRTSGSEGPHAKMARRLPIRCPQGVVRPCSKPSLFPRFSPSVTASTPLEQKPLTTSALLVYNT